MTQDNASKVFGGFCPFSAFSSMLDMQLKGFQAVTEAQMRLFEGAQSIATMQAEVMTEAAEAFSGCVKEAMSGNFLCSVSGRQADFVREGYGKSISNMQEMISIADKSGKAAAAIISDHITSSLSALQSAAKPAGNDAKKAPAQKAA